MSRAQTLKKKLSWLVPIGDRVFTRVTSLFIY